MLLVFPLTAAAIAWAAQYAPPDNALAQTLLEAAITTAVILLPVELLLARDWLTRSRCYARDLRTGAVKRFSEQGAEAAAESVEVLPVSHRLWTRNDARVVRWTTAYWGELAAVPAMSAIASQYLQPSGQDGDRILFTNRRDLSKAEVGEIRGIARAIWVKPLLLAAGLTLWSSLGVTSFVLGHMHNWFNIASFVFLSVYAVVANILFINRALMGMKLSRDAGQAFVTLIKIEHAAAAASQQIVESNFPSEELDGAASAAVVTEVLPVSSLVWLSGGKPPPWRQIARIKQAGK
jgi:hypothetical protein